MIATSEIDMISKLPNTGISIFTIMSQMAREYGAVNLSQGFPDFDVSEELINLVNKYMKQGANQYAPMPGIIQLREIISNKIEKLYGHCYHPESEITITSGATQALYTAIDAFIWPKDEVIIFEPCYDSYVPAIILNGGKPIYIQLNPENNYKIPWSEVRQKLSSKTRMLIINTPHNPTSSVFDKEDIQELENIVNNTSIIILSDEVYEHIIFDDLKHQSVISSPELINRSLAVFSFGKTFHVTGWKTGYITGPEYLMKEYRKVHQYNVFSSNTPIQFALTDYMSIPENYENVNTMYEQKRNLFNRLIKDSRFKPLPAFGTYFQLLDYSNISEQKDIKFAEYLTKEKGLATVPVSVFYHDNSDYHVIRVCFAKKEETIIQAAKILCTI